MWRIAYQIAAMAALFGAAASLPATAQERDHAAVAAAKVEKPPPPGYSRAVEPRNMSRWAQQVGQNYPSQAMRENLEGRVLVRLLVGSNGRVSACDVTASSGHPVLDNAACQGMLRYSRFEPALDLSGQPKAAYWYTGIVYML